MNLAYQSGAERFLFRDGCPAAVCSKELPWVKKPELQVSNTNVTDDSSNHWTERWGVSVFIARADNDKEMSVLQQLD